MASATMPSWDAETTTLPDPSVRSLREYTPVTPTVIRRLDTTVAFRAAIDALDSARTFGDVTRARRRLVGFSPSALPLLLGELASAQPPDRLDALLMLTASILPLAAALEAIENERLRPELRASLILSLSAYRAVDPTILATHARRISTTLESAARSPTTAVRYAAAEAIGLLELHDDAAKAVLRDLAADPDEAVRSEASEVLRDAG